MDKKIIHINSSGSGGAFTFVKMLHENLLKNNINSIVLTRFYQKKDNGFFKHSIIGNISLKRFLKKIIAPAFFKNGQKMEMFTVPILKSSVSRNGSVRRSEVIHLHWISDMVAVSEIVEMSKTKKVFWTLHDMNPFTGGCHYSYDCEQYIEGCKNCSQLGEKSKEVASYFKAKEKEFRQIDKKSLIIISPSRWILEKAEKSTLMNEFKHVFIPHFIDTEVFKFMEKQRSRKVTGLPEGRTVFLYISHVIEDERKGFSKVMELAGKMTEALFIFAGRVKDLSPFNKMKNIKILNSIDNRKDLANYYTASDFLINFTVAESFGLTTAESLCCGTPVICYSIPVMLEHIHDGVNGICINNDLSDINARIALFRKNGNSGPEISLHACKKYGAGNFEKYLELYRQ